MQIHNTKKYAKNGSDSVRILIHPDPKTAGSEFLIDYYYTNYSHRVNNSWPVLVPGTVDRRLNNFLLHYDITKIRFIFC
jgi:hypothetical protein